MLLKFFFLFGANSLVHAALLNSDGAKSSEVLSIESAKQAAAYAAVDKYITSDVSVIGVGTGTTVKFVVDRIKQIQENLRRSQDPKEFVCIPSSDRTKSLILENGLTLGDLDHYPEIDVCIDGADEVDSNLNAIKGGGGALFQEKVLASASKKFIVVADYRKDSTVLGQQWKGGVPIEVVPLAQKVVANRLLNLGYNPILRENGEKNGAYITDNGNYIFDLQTENIPNPKEVEANLKSIPGILEVGLFCEMVECAYFAALNGTVSVREKTPK